MKRLQGQRDSRGPQGIMARGAPVYNAGLPQAQSGGGPQFGRPPEANAQEALRQAVMNQIGVQGTPTPATPQVADTPTRNMGGQNISADALRRRLQQARRGR